MRGDDGVGPAVARRLSELIAPDERLLIIDGGHAPENCLGPVIRFRPEVILFIDAIRGSRPPGALRLLSAGKADSAGGSTHTLSLGMLAEYLVAETGAIAYVLGIQPSNLEFGEGLSDPVEASVEETARTLARYWRKVATACSAIINGESSVVST